MTSGSWQVIGSVVPALVIGAAIAGTHMPTAAVTTGGKLAGRHQAALGRVQIKHAPLILSGLAASAFGDWEFEG